jgi:hypothetical protein
MRFLLVVAAMAMAVLTTETTASEDPMAKYRGSDRPIVIFAPDRYDQRLVEQIGRFSIHRREFRDRDVIVIEVGGPFMRAEGRGLPHAPEMRERYDVSEDDFTVILIGKDGGEKLRVSEVTDPRVFYDLIDTMPMRQQEIEQGN